MFKRLSERNRVMPKLQLGETEVCASAERIPRKHLRDVHNFRQNVISRVRRLLLLSDVRKWHTSPLVPARTEVLVPLFTCAIILSCSALHIGGGLLRAYPADQEARPRRGPLG